MVSLTDGFLERMGKETIDALAATGEFLAFLGDATLALGNLLRGRARFPFSEFWAVLQNTGCRFEHPDLDAALRAELGL